MQRTDRFPPSGFTLIEIMLAIAVIGILMGMLGASAYSARQRAYASTATAETQQIATAFKSYYLAHKKWPGAWEKGKDWTKLDSNNLQPLLGGSGGDGIVYLDLSASRFEGKFFLDPWGRAYEVKTSMILNPKVSDTFEGAVSFPNHMRHYGEDGVFDLPAEKWEDTWDGYSL
jgi:prepilin-type N-terminal cleavage/methylation domain-containing protein